MFRLRSRSGVLPFQALQCPSHDLVGSLAPLFCAEARGGREQRIEHFDLSQQFKLYTRFFSYCQYSKMLLDHALPDRSLRSRPASLRVVPDGSPWRLSKPLILVCYRQLIRGFQISLPALREDTGLRSYATRLASHRPVPNWLRLTMPRFWSLAAPSTAVPLIAPSRI